MLGMDMLPGVLFGDDKMARVEHMVRVFADHCSLGGFLTPLAGVIGILSIPQSSPIQSIKSPTKGRGSNLWQCFNAVCVFLIW